MRYLIVAVVALGLAPATSRAEQPRVEGIATIGGGYTHWFGYDVGSVSLLGGVGMHTKWFAARGEVFYDHGNAGGLIVRRGGVSPHVEAVLGRLRLGCGLGLAHASFDRVTRNDSVGAFVLLPHVAVSLDLVQTKHVDVLLGARGNLEIGLATDRGFANPGLFGFAGVRFR